MFHNPALLAVLFGQSWTPAALFSAGEQGVWYDPSDFSTMFQDSAGTTPVTAVEQSVGLILDKSGRGNHASQATGISRPVLKQDANGMFYLLFDGSNDSLATATIDPGSVDKVQVFAGVRKLSDAALAMVVEFSASSGANTNAFSLTAPQAASASYGSNSRGSGALRSAVYTDVSVTSPVTSVIAGLSDISGPSTVLRLNGAQVASSTLDQGTGNYASYPLYIGRRGGTLSPYNGHLYGLIARFSAANLPAAQITSAEAWMNAKTRAY